MNEKPLYEAISYKWGGNRGHDITCNKQSLPVNAKLVAALERLRLPQEPRTLWIDEIWINQDDLEDRAHQVQRFHRIYAGATSVLIWLGPESSDSDVAMDFILRIMDHLSDKGSKQEITDPDIPSIRNAAYRTPKRLL